MSFTVITLEPTNYLDALIFQENFFHAQLEKKAKGIPTANTLILLQHTPVYTLGKSGDINNLKVPIEETDAEFYRTKRGGDITYHGPGQMTGYPVFDLSTFDLGVRKYVETLEQCIIDCIAEYGLEGKRIDSVSGVWIDAESDAPRKICAVGLQVSRGVSMHGFAFNVNTNLEYFENIIPCGLEDKKATSLEKELGRKVDYLEVEQKIIAQFSKHFQKVTT